MQGPEFQFLQSIDILAGLDDNLIHFLASRLHKKKFRKGEHIFFQGEVVSHFYFVEMGRVEIYKSDMDGRKLTLWFIEPKGSFCMASLHTPAAFANALVIEDAMLYTLKEQDFDAFVSQSGELATRFVHCMSKKMALYSAIVDDMAFKGIMARLAKVLLEYRTKDDVSGMTFCQLSQGELASLVGTCREVVARSLKKLRDEEIVATSLSRQIIIIQPDRLKKYCD